MTSRAGYVPAVYEIYFIISIARSLAFVNGLEKQQGNFLYITIR